MSNWGNDWSEFMQSKQARLVLHSFCAIICAFYAIDAVREMLSPERSAMMIEQVGATMYYVLTVCRTLVCVWVSVMFGRMTLKTLKEKDENDK